MALQRYSGRAGCTTPEVSDKCRPETAVGMALSKLLRLFDRPRFRAVAASETTAAESDDKVAARELVDKVLKGPEAMASKSSATSNG